MLLVLMIAVAVLTITMLGVARNYRRGIVRDREVEMMHRGDQYARAVKRFYKKNGSYPTSIEQLEKTNNIRYLRKRYKDPMSPDGAWKLAHLTDVTLTPAGGLVPAVGGANALSQPQANAGALSGAASTSGGAAGTPTAQSPDSSNPGAGSTSGGATTGGTTDAGATTGAAGTAFGSTGTSNNAATSGQVLGGGPIIGVVSTQKREGIHSFGGKTKYNEWFFIYDPNQDKGQLLTGPYNPKAFMGTTNAGVGTTSNPASGTGNATTQGIGASNPASPINPPAQPTPSLPTQ